MSLDSCMEIYFTKFNNYSMCTEALDKIIRASIINKNEEEVGNLGLEQKKEIFYLQKYYLKSLPYYRLH